MPPSGVQDIAPWQRTVLLASDCKNSVLAETVAGETRHVGYSAYGTQSSRQKLMSHLGFNGELREARMGWYLLGNGYRAYNPGLMRFHSPDAFSPFGEGGLNAYMYCGGEPVMNEDPTGRTFLSKFFKVTDFLNLSNTSSGSRPNMLARPPKSGKRGFEAVVVAFVEGTPPPRKTRPLDTGGGSSRPRKTNAPSFKRSEHPTPSVSSNTVTKRYNQTTSAQTMTDTTLPSIGNSRRTSVSSHYSSVSSPSTVSTLSSISVSSGDTGFYSNASGTSSSTFSGVSDVQRRLDDLRGS